MKALPLILLAACGSSAPPPAEPAPVAEPVPVAQVQQPAPATEPARSEPETPAPPPAAPQAPPAPLHDRLRDQDGAIAGLPGFSIKRTPSKNHCGGVKITTKRSKKIAAADKQLAAVFALEFPTDLDFNPDPKHKARREKSMQTFQTFVETMQKTGGEATKFYTDQLSKKEIVTTVSSLARIVQINYRLVSVLARAEIPKDVRTGEFKDEATAAFCDKMIDISEPLLAQAESALAYCTENVAKLAATGWWNDVCGPK